MQQPYYITIFQATLEHNCMNIMLLRQVVKKNGVIQVDDPGIQ